MKNIQRNTIDFQIFSFNFCGTVLMLSVLEVLILTLVIFGGAK